jgi:hypothetical protein
VSVTLYDIIQHNHACQQFNSDTTYVAHPDLRPGEDAQDLFSTLPISHWQDIFDQMAYIYENGIVRPHKKQRNPTAVLTSFLS